jgi:hypothetical protein
LRTRSAAIFGEPDEELCGAVLLDQSELTKPALCSEPPLLRSGLYAVVVYDAQVVRIESVAVVCE